MIAEPTTPLVTTPVGLTVAIDGEPLVHVPLPVTLLNVVELPPGHKEKLLPVIGVPVPTVIAINPVQPVTV